MSVSYERFLWRYETDGRAWLYVAKGSSINEESLGCGCILQLGLSPYFCGSFCAYSLPEFSLALSNFFKQFLLGY